MKKLIIVSFFLLLLFTRQTFGSDTTELMAADIASSNLHLEEASITSANKVAIVDKSGLHYSDPIAAMNDIATWCGVPAASNRCLIRILPGVYDLGINTLYMEPYVDVEGSGENATKIEGQSRPNGVVRVSGNSELRYLTVEHTGGEAFFSVAVMGSEDQDTNASKKLTNMTIISVMGTGLNVGIHYPKLGFPETFTHQPLVVSNVTVIASGGNGGSMGIFQGYGIIKIYRSFIKGDAKSIKSTGDALIYNSVLDGPVRGSGPITCSNVYDKDYNFYAKTCP